MSLGLQPPGRALPCLPSRSRGLRLTTLYRQNVAVCAPLMGLAGGA